MTEQTTASGNWQEQKRNKPAIETFVLSVVTDSRTKETMLGFIAHLRKNNFGIVWSAANDWWVTLYCQPVCKISLRVDDRTSGYTWAVTLRLNRTVEYQGIIDSEGLQDYISRNDPDEAAVKRIKRLLELEKKATIGGQKNAPSLYQQQKAVKPPVEDIIPQFLSGDMMTAALDFAAWLRKSKLSPGWTLSNWWNVNHKGKTLCKIHLGEDVYSNSARWFVSLRLNHLNTYDESVASEGLQNIVWDSIKYCTSCTGCAPGRDVTLYGRQCKGLCHVPVLIVCDPDANTLDGIKRLLELEKAARDNAGKG